MQAPSLPVIDFATCGLNVPDGHVTKENQQATGAAIVEAFSSTGFCYLQNHGISEKYIEECHAICKKFYLLPYSFKDKYRRLREDGNYLGWVGMEDEATNPNRPGDLKEAFNYYPNGSWGDWPDDVVPEYKTMCSELFNISKRLALRIIEAIAVAMDLPEDNDLTRCHKLVGHEGNHSELRTLYYPPLEPGTVFKENQVRLGEHFDFGSLTVLFQDDVGGLEVCSAEGRYVPATPIPGSVLINIGEIMQRWTADRLVATKHRVMLPVLDKTKQSRARQSMGFFLFPDDVTQITCLDGSNKYPPVQFYEHVVTMIDAVYKMKR